MYFHYNWNHCLFSSHFLPLIIYFVVICAQLEVELMVPCTKVPQKHLSIKPWGQCHDIFFWMFFWQSVFFFYVYRSRLHHYSCGADANYQLLHLLCISNKQIKPITSCVPEDFVQESPSRHQVFRLANAKIHKLGISWIILFANKHLFIRNVADIASSPFIYIHVCVGSV